MFTAREDRGIVLANLPLALMDRAGIPTAKKKNPDERKLRASLIERGEINGLDGGTRDSRIKMLREIQTEF